MENRECRKCGIEKDIEEFRAYRGKLGQESRHYTCKVCKGKGEVQWRKDNPENHRRAMKKMHLKKRFGMTLEDWDLLMESQGGVCAICGGVGESRNGRTKDLAVDHDHQTGEVRGPLCGQCNMGLGSFRDTIEMLEKAIAYLSRQ